MGKAQFNDRLFFVLLTATAFLVSGIASTKTDYEIKKEIRDSFHEFDKHYSMKIDFVNYPDYDADLFWKNMEIEENATKLSDDQFVNGKAIVDLPFKFKFYHINYYSVSVTKEGTILTDEPPDAWIIAPLNAKVGMTRCNVYHLHQGDSFYVQWNNFRFNHDKFGEHEFSFQFRLSASGEIVFVYKKVPYNLTNLRKNCDFCLEEKFGVRFPHQEDFKFPPYYVTYQLGYAMDFGKYEVKQGTVIRFVSADMCMFRKTCRACIRTKFREGPYKFSSCSWCPEIQKCSSTRDSLRHVWKENKCDIHHVNAQVFCKFNNLSQVPIQRDMEKDIIKNIGGFPRFTMTDILATDIDVSNSYELLWVFILLTVVVIICISASILFKDKIVKICYTLPSNEPDQPVDNNQAQDQNND
ncbi:Hypothetical predicted protein [Cloeon dipterum]|uniref:PSI domain-containing protein n=1 Tax=Cloeon dipterum TaxID=197152 RepID=A0A8S1DKI0_9INSE|nr:Hypothetical predicted protein [Cloeon dipterum]